MYSVEYQTAVKLLEISAVKVQPNKPFTWASGWLSPIYCDNRVVLSYPEVRSFVRDSLCKLAETSFSEFDAIAGVATGAIAQGALVADFLKKPFVYVRSAPKDHGTSNLIEGRLKPGARVLVVEDLISTGGSGLKAVEVLQKAGATVVGIIASFTYGFPQADNSFAKAGVKLCTLTNYEYILKAALESGYIEKGSLETLNEWRKNPAQWKR